MEMQSSQWQSNMNGYIYFTTTSTKVIVNLWGVKRVTFYLVEMCQKFSLALIFFSDFKNCYQTNVVKPIYPVIKKVNTFALC